jgi:hypothetical protein
MKLRIDEALDRLGWSATVLAAAAVIGEPHISEMRAGRKLPGLPVALALAEVTGWTIDSLVGDRPLGKPDFDRLAEPSMHTTLWGDSIRALVEAHGMRAVARKVKCDHSCVHAYLRGVEPRLTTAVRYSRALGQQVHAMALGRPHM